MADRQRMIMRNRNKVLMKKRMGQLIDQVRCPCIHHTAQGPGRAWCSVLTASTCANAGGEGEACQRDEQACPGTEQFEAARRTRKGAPQDLSRGQGTPQRRAPVAE